MAYILEWNGAYYADNPPVSPFYGWVLNIYSAKKFSTEEEAQKV